MFDEHVHYEPNRRMNPPFTGDVDTTQMGGIYDVQNMHGKPDPHCGYHIPTIPPLSPVFDAMTESEQLRDLAHKVNELCGTIAGYNSKVEDAYKAIINSALCNDSYYKEVTVENGYMPESGSNYKVIHIPFLDRANQPIFFELGLAHDNTTNAGVKEECFNASQRFVADKLIPAQNTGDSFTGTVTWKNAPIYTATGDSYTFAVTQNGFFKAYKNATADILKQDKIRNSCGARGMLVYNKALATDSFPDDASTMKARIAVGQNYDTKERFIIVVDGGESVGCTSEQLANLFVKYGCMVAIELVSGSSVYGMDKGAMMYSPVVASEYDTPSVPVSNAFWYITKRRHYHNDYVKDVAQLMQKMGEEIWRRIILNEQTDFVKQAVVDLKKALDTETEERKSEDNRIESESKDRDETLQKNLDTEVARIDANCDRIESESKARDDELTELIKTKERESKERDSQLQVNIDNEAKTRESQDVKKVGYVDDGDKRTYSLYRNDDTKIPENIEVYEYNKLVAQLITLGEVAENLKTETQERKKGDDNLQSQITAEIANRSGAVTDLQNQITKEISDRATEDTAIKALISAEVTARENGDTELANSISKFKNDYETFKSDTNSDLQSKQTQINSIVADVTNIKTVIDTHTTQMSSINETITALQTTVSTMETSLENMKTTISNLQTSWTNYKAEVDKSIAEMQAIIDAFKNTFVKKVGDTMTGDLLLENALLKVHKSETIGEETYDFGTTIFRAQGFTHIEGDGKVQMDVITNLKEVKFNYSSPDENELVKLDIGEPTDTMHATTKNYVDNADALKVNVSDEMTDAELTDVLNIFEV